MRYAIVIAAAVVSSAADIAAQPTRAHGEMILNALVFFAPPMVADSTIDPALRGAVAAYLRRSAAYRPKVRTSDIPEFGMIAPVWEAYERRLAAMSERNDAPALAQAYVDSLRPPYEWEGFHDGPEAEAVFADRYLRAHARGPFSEYLPLLAAHRWLCAAEGYAYEGDTTGAARSRREFLRLVVVGVKSPDLLVRAASRRLEQRQTCLPAAK